MALRKEDLRQIDRLRKLNEAATAEAERVYSEILAKNPQLRREDVTQRMYLNAGGSVNTWKMLMQQGIAGEISQIPESENVTDLEERRKQKEERTEQTPHGQAHRPPPRTSSEFLEDHPLFQKNMARLRQDWEQKRDTAIEGLSKPEAPEKPTLSTKLYQSYAEYKAAQEAYRIELEKYTDRRAAYIQARDKIYEGQGLTHLDLLNYYGHIDPNDTSKTIYQQAREATLNDLEDLSQKKEPTLASRNAARQLARYKAELTSIGVHPEEDHYIQQTHQRIVENIQARNRWQFEQLVKSNPKLTFREYLQSSDYREMVQQAHLSGWKSFEQEFQTKAKYYKWYVERQKILYDPNISKVDKTRLIKELRKREKETRDERRNKRREQKLALKSTRLSFRAAFAQYREAARNSRRENWQNIKQKADQSRQNLRHPIKTIRRFYNNLKTVRNIKNFIKEPREFINNLSTVRRWRRRINMARNVFRFATNSEFRTSVFQNLGSRINNAISFFRNIPGNISRVFSNISSSLGRIGQTFNTALNFLRTGIQQLPQAFSSAFNAIFGPGGAVEAISGAMAELSEAIGAMFNVLLDGIAFAGELVTTVIGAIGEAIANLITIIITSILGAGISAIGMFFLIAFLILVFIVIIILIILLFLSPQVPHYTVVACSEYPGMIASDSMGLVIKDDFGIAVEYNGNSGTPQKSVQYYQSVLDTNYKAFNALCRLFGHVGYGHHDTTQGQPLAGQDNTFANLFRGKHHQYDTPSAVNIINFWFLGDPNSDGFVKTKTPCSYELRPIGGDKDMELWFYQPDKCPVDSTFKVDPNSPSTVDYHFEFLLDKALATVVIHRSLDQKDPVFTDFINSPYQFDLKKNITLPNPDCQGANGKSSDGNACFEDMVADYLNWGGNYFDFPINGLSSGGANNVSDLAKQLITTLSQPIGKGGCGGRVTIDNIGCLNSLSPNPGKVVTDRLRLNTSQDNVLQCAGFSQAVGIGINAPIGDGNASMYINYGSNPPKSNAWTWVKNNQNDPTQKIQVGDMPVWYIPGSCQHIAVVTSVKGDGSLNFTVAEANGDNSNPAIPSAGTVDFQNYIRINGFCNLQGWLHKQ